jgi:hypothetical protein
MKQSRQREGREGKGREGKEGRESSHLKQVLKQQSLTTCLLCATEVVAYGWYVKFLVMPTTTYCEDFYLYIYLLINLL